jgi:hypothetical protein
MWRSKAAHGEEKLRVEGEQIPLDPIGRVKVATDPVELACVKC